MLDCQVLEQFENRCFNEEGQRRGRGKNAGSWKVDLVCYFLFCLGLSPRGIKTPSLAWKHFTTSQRSHCWPSGSSSPSGSQH